MQRSSPPQDAPLFFHSRRVPSHYDRDCPPTQPTIQYSHSHGASYSSQASDENYDYLNSLSLPSDPSLDQDERDQFEWIRNPEEYDSDRDSDIGTDDRFCSYDDLSPSPSPSASPRQSTSTSTSDPTMPLFHSLALMLSSSLSSSAPPSLDTCFCGKAADEDSIYCSVACGRKDAMTALESGNSKKGKEECHYRRVELEETKAKERKENSLARSKKAARSSPSPSSASRSTSHSTAPSLSSTTSSIDSYSTCATDFDSPCPSPVPQLYYPSTPTRSPNPNLDSLDVPSPQPTLRPGYSTEDIYGAYHGEGEERDRVTSSLGAGLGLGWGMNSKAKQAPRVREQKHQRGKLSFDDVVGIMSA